MVGIVGSASEIFMDQYANLEVDNFSMFINSPNVLWHHECNRLVVKLTPQTRPAEVPDGR